MKKLFYYLKALFSGWGTDKWAYFGIRGLACALATVVTTLIEHHVELSEKWRN